MRLRRAQVPGFAHALRRWERELARHGRMAWGEIVSGAYTVVVRISRDCNMRCSYCYSSRSRLSADSETMSADLAADICKQFLDLPLTRVAFNWHGGEPTLADPDVVRAAIEVQQSHPRASEVEVSNKIQTNGMDLPRPWVELLRQYPIDVGLSIDGPAALHDVHRRGLDAKPTFDRVMNSVDVLRSEGIRFGVLMVVTEALAADPDLVYEFVSAKKLDFDLLPCFRRTATDARPDPTTITPRSFARFLIRFFERWIQDPAPPNCRMMVDLLAGAVGLPPQSCMFRDACSSFLSIDTQGRLFGCDLFLGEDRAFLGMLSADNSLTDILGSARASTVLSRSKELPAGCRTCKWLHRCSGGCKGQRTTLPERSPRYHFCESRKAVFAHVDRFVAAHPELIDAVKAYGLEGKA